MTHSAIVTFIWGVADLIRDTFRRGHYQDVILPLTVLRRLDCVLAPTGFWLPMRKSLGDKRRESPLTRIQDILKMLADFRDEDTRVVSVDGEKKEVVVSRIFPNTPPVG